jgi:hypothetical protein
MTTVQQIRIEPGESLASLALRVYGDESLWREVGAAIDRSVFDPLTAGEEIKLPSKQEIFRIAEKAATTALQGELQKQFPELDLSGIKGIDGNLFQLIEWIL